MSPQDGTLSARNLAEDQSSPTYGSAITASHRNAAWCQSPVYTVIFDMGVDVSASGVEMAGWRSTRHNPTQVTWFSCSNSSIVDYGGMPQGCSQLGTYALLSRSRTRAKLFCFAVLPVPLLEGTALVPMRRHPDDRHPVDTPHDRYNRNQANLGMQQHNNVFNTVSRYWAFSIAAWNPPNNWQYYISEIGLFGTNA